MPQPAVRVAAIDQLRALTMLLMIIVNDLWSLKGIPGWLEHVPADADGMGLADVVFPGFLFIVGMSVPFAVGNRRQKGENRWQISYHIAERGVALLVMGLFLVNGEYINELATGFQRGWWNILACTGFILIWNKYPSTWSRPLVYTLKIAGALTLLTLAICYRGGEDNAISYFNTWWWGILGLIGWAYLLSSLLYVWCNGNPAWLFAGWLASILLCAANHSGFLPGEAWWRKFISPIGEGAMTGFTIGGAFAAEIFRRRSASAKNWYASFAGAAIVLLAIGFATRPLWGISKIRATPSWVMICSAIMLLAFIFMYRLAENRRSGWYEIIRPAGTETLLCYLIPYYCYGIVQLAQWWLPDPLLTGWIGIFKSVLFAIIVIQAAGLLSKKLIRLRL
ncbi:DUF5009 domain-containing protein [Flavihumibacter solisilvae]|uniref:DUF5009 domain-containing protein n=1 Tax=Flavihumibacter solisilvae TaxID=1349421 RepID=A0A0C1I9L1_9BACT|nr:DUF5009 domain-containing protein [Flavihumibacter solisilvae]KIC90700.1 hypothetical protein OI18_22635 [Flavihumibacter solisilvae]